MDKKIALVCLLCFMALTTHRILAQTNSAVRSGLLKTDLTFSPGYSFGSKSTNYYIHGLFEGYLNSRVSATGEGYYQIVDSDGSPFKYNHSLFYGMSYHFASQNNDLFLGIQPGFSISKLKYNEESATTAVNPLFSAVAGYNYYLNKIFHFFIQARVLSGTHIYDHVESLAEFRMSAGLGFNINTMKPK